MFPTGTIVRTTRLRAENKFVSGAGFIIRLKAEPPVGMKPADMRRAFTRFAKQLHKDAQAQNEKDGIIITECEHAHGTYGQKGQVIESGIVSAYHCLGSYRCLAALAAHFAVDEWHPIINAAIPFAAAGSGPEKVRPSPGKPVREKPNSHDTAEALKQHGRYLTEVRAEMREASIVG